MKSTALVGLHGSMSVLRRSRYALVAGYAESVWCRFFKNTLYKGMAPPCTRAITAVSLCTCKPAAPQASWFAFCITSKFQWPSHVYRSQEISLLMLTINQPVLHHHPCPKHKFLYSVIQNWTVHLEVCVRQSSGSQALTMCSFVMRKDATPKIGKQLARRKQEVRRGHTLWRGDSREHIPVFVPHSERVCPTSYQLCPLWGGWDLQQKRMCLCEW